MFNKKLSSLLCLAKYGPTDDKNLVGARCPDPHVLDCLSEANEYSPSGLVYIRLGTFFAGIRVLALQPKILRWLTSCLFRVYVYSKMIAFSARLVGSLFRK